MSPSDPAAPVEDRLVAALDRRCPKVDGSTLRQFVCQNAFLVWWLAAYHPDVAESAVAYIHAHENGGQQ